MNDSAILVGVDGSPAADHAVAWTVAYAARQGASVRALMTWDVPAYMSLGPLTSDPSPASRSADAARATLEAVEERVEDGPGGPVVTVLRQGPAAATLLAEAAEIDASLVVVGTRGLGPVRRAVMGSVSSRVARDSTCPVAVVAPGAPVDSSGPVVVGVDGSAGSIAALRWAAQATEGTIHAVHLMEYPFGPEDAVEGLVFEDHESFGRQVAERTVADAIGGRDDISIGVTSGDPRDILNTVATAARASMIVVGARGGKGLAGLGSVATSVASSADVTVVIVPVP